MRRRKRRRRKRRRGGAKETEEKNYCSLVKTHDYVEKSKAKPPHTWNIEVIFPLSLFEPSKTLYFQSFSGTKLEPISIKLSLIIIAVVLVKPTDFVDTE